MTLEGQRFDEPVATPNAEPVETQADEQANQEPPDYAALYEHTRLENEKLANDIKAVRTGTMKQQERDRLLYDISDRLSGTEQANRALMQAIASGNVDELPSQLGQIDTEIQNKQQQSRAQSANATLWAQLQEAVVGEDGNAILDLQNAPELEGLRAAWNTAADAGDVLGLSQAIGEAHKIARQVERKNLQKAAADARKQAEEERKKLLENTDALDMDNGPGASGGSSRPTGVSLMSKALKERGGL